MFQQLGDDFGGGTKILSEIINGFWVGPMMNSGHMGSPWWTPVLSQLTTIFKETFPKGEDLWSDFEPVQVTRETGHQDLAPFLYKLGIVSSQSFAFSFLMNALLCLYPSAIFQFQLCAYSVQSPSLR